MNGGSAYPRAFLLAQTVRNLPAMRETWVRPLGGEGPLEKGMGTHSSILARRIPGIAHGIAKSQTLLNDQHTQSLESHNKEKLYKYLLAKQTNGLCRKVNFNYTSCNLLRTLVFTQNSCYGDKQEIFK